MDSRAETQRHWQADRHSPIAILGIGNLLLSDDGVGIHAIQMLRNDPDIDSVACILDGGTIGTELLAEICGFEKLLIVDAVDANVQPGTILWVDLTAPDPQRVVARNAHQSGIPGLLDDLRLLGCEPRQVALVGVQPATIGFGTQLSPAVSRALPDLTKQVSERLQSWTVGAERIPEGSHTDAAQPTSMMANGTLGTV